MNANLKVPMSALLLLALVFTTCEKNSLGTSENDVTFEAKNSKLIISNKSDQIVHFFIVERAIAAVIDWAPGCNLEEGTFVAPKETQTLEYEDIFGYKADCEIICYWWACPLTEGSKRTMDKVHNVVVQTK